MVQDGGRAIVGAVAAGGSGRGMGSNAGSDARPWTAGAAPAHERVHPAADGRCPTAEPSNDLAKAYEPTPSG
jgi:hypothetical protein